MKLLIFVIFSARRLRRRGNSTIRLRGAFGTANSSSHITHRSTGSHWKVVVPWRELALQDWPSWGSRRCGGECWRQLNRVRVGSVNRCEMPMAGRAHLHPPAHRVDGQDQSCKRSWLVPEHRVQRGSGPTEDPYQAKQLQQTQERGNVAITFFTLIDFSIQLLAPQER